MESFIEKNKINKIPIIIKKKKNDTVLSKLSYLKYKLPELDKCKFLVPKDLTVAQFIYVIRKRLKLSYEKSIIIYFKNSEDKLFIYPNSHTLEAVYNETRTSDVSSKKEYNCSSGNNKNDDVAIVDKFLYAFYTGENTFG
jgi:hypothetical protein